MIPFFCLYTVLKVAKKVRFSRVLLLLKILVKCFNDLCNNQLTNILQGN